MLAAEEITIRIGGERIVLRPTLRVALRLERRHEGLDALVAKLSDGDLQAIADVLREHTSTWSEAADFIESLGDRGVYAGALALIPALIAHVYACAGIDLSEPEDDHEKSKMRDPHGRTRREAFASHLVSLFKIGTGWLGWSPETTWNATPAEIRAAREGFIDLQNALNGVSPKEQDARSLDDKFRDVFAGLNARIEAA